jgi:hypothetical protein
MNKEKNKQGTVTINENTPRTIEELVDDFFASGKKIAEFEKGLGQRELTLWKSQKEEFLLDGLDESQTLFDEDFNDGFYDDGIGY